MRYNPPGRTGPFVSEPCLGATTFGGGKGFFKAAWQVQQDEADALLEAAVDAGVNSIATANVCSKGLSEIAGRAIRHLGLKREDIVLATRAFGLMGDRVNARDASRARIMDQVERLAHNLDTVSRVRPECPGQMTARQGEDRRGAHPGPASSGTGR